MAKKKAKRLKFNVFGKEVQVIHDPSLRDNGLEGTYIPKKNIIIHATHSNNDELLRTLIHELIHSVVYITGVGQTSLSHDVEEILCENVSHAIVDNFDIRIKR